MKTNLFALLLALTLALCACAAPAGDGSGGGSADPNASLSGLGQAAGMDAANPPQGGDPVRDAFRTALEQLYNEQVLPNGDALEMADFSDITTSRFSVFDIDQDGEEELIFTFNDTYTAGMATYVFGYDAELGRLIIELWEYPSLAFYNTGVVEARASHNHGPAGDALWPFILYQYEPMADDYRKVAVVDAWDRSFAGDSIAAPNGDGMETLDFPRQADADGDGVVYYVMYNGYALEEPMDGPAFWEWYSSWFLGAEEITIPYVSLTPENIQAVQ